LSIVHISFAQLSTATLQRSRARRGKSDGAADFSAKVLLGGAALFQLRITGTRKRSTDCTLYAIYQLPL